VSSLYLGVMGVVVVSIMAAVSFVDDVPTIADVGRCVELQKQRV
jgi:hypothetical protein